MAGRQPYFQGRPHRINESSSVHDDEDFQPNRRQQQEFINPHMPPNHLGNHRFEENRNGRAPNHLAYGNRVPAYNGEHDEDMMMFDRSPQRHEMERHHGGEFPNGRGPGHEDFSANSKAPSLFLHYLRLPRPLHLPSYPQAYTVPTVPLELPVGQKPVLQVVQNLLFNKRSAIESPEFNNQITHERNLRQLIGKNTNVTQLKKLPVKFISDYCNLSVDYFSNMLKQQMKERGSNQEHLQQQQQMFEKMRRDTETSIAPLLKKLRVIYSKSLNSITDYFQKQTKADLSDAFLSDYEENDLKDTWARLQNIIGSAFNNYIRWSNKQHEIIKKRATLLDECSTQTGQDLLKKLQKVKIKNQTQYTIIYLNLPLRIEPVLKSLEPKEIMEQVVVSLYYEYLKEVHNINQSEVVIKDFNQTDKFMVNVRSYYEANRKEKLFSTFNTVVFLLKHRQAHDGKIGDYALMVYHCKPDPNNIDKLRQIIIYDPTLKHVNYYHDFRRNVQTYLDSEIGYYNKGSWENKFERFLVQENLVTKEANPLKSVENDTSGIRLLYNLSQVVLHGIPETKRLDVSSEKLERIREKMKLFIKYLAYCSSDNEPRYPNMDYLDYCTKELTSKHQP